MDLRNDIKKATALTSSDNDAKFYLLQEPSQATKDKKMNERSVRKPRNIHVSICNKCFILLVIKIMYFNYYLFK